MNGFLLTIIVDDDLFVLEFFRFFRIGIGWKNDEISNHKTFILGLWKFEISLTFAIRKKIKWHEMGQA
jgi:hypothetical protein